MLTKIGSHGTISVYAGGDIFLAIQSRGNILKLSAPSFSTNLFGNVNKFTYVNSRPIRLLPNGGEEYLLDYESPNGLLLELQLRIYEQSPVTRFRYFLKASQKTKLSKPDGKDRIKYWSIALPNETAVSEIQFAQFLPQLHTFTPIIANYTDTELNTGVALPGPGLLLENEKFSAILAYEHGAEYPDSYLAFHVKQSHITLKARRGNYYNGQLIDLDHSFRSCWFHIAFGNCGKDELMKQYRFFILNDLCEKKESRYPYIYYNTWNYQEKDHNFFNRPYLVNMNEKKIIKEIKVAHRMGIEIFVIDTGWFSKTGDWAVNQVRFPDNMKKVRELLDQYGMKLGLWFNPTVAAKTSRSALLHPEYRMSWEGESHCSKIWETEESYGMCLCSPYAEEFADLLIHLYKELGVRYFKWDGISQYGCDSPLHNHGGKENTAKERAECYSYQMGLRMIDIVERLTEACPEAIVDFDVTEGGRFMGLGFLSVGKYFLINNGPYASDFDLPSDYRYQLEKPIYLFPGTNIFFYPGAARPRFCRQGILYDFIVPSILFLTHYLPEGNDEQKENSFTSLVLGGNGIWGSLSDLSEEDISFWKEHLEKYKMIREAVTSVPAKIRGTIGSSPEIYEKLNVSKRSGIIAFFTHHPGTYSWITSPFPKHSVKVFGADNISALDDGSLSISVKLRKDGAKTVFIFPVP